MKKIIAVALFLIISATSFSQKISFSIGPELALPNSSYNFTMDAGTGFGASVRAELSWSKHLSGIATVGYISFAQKELPYSGTPPTIAKVNAIPIQAGVKYYPIERKETSKGIFISAELGFMPTTTHFDYAVNTDRSFKESGLSCAPGIGYQTGNIEASFRPQYNLTVSGTSVYYYNFRIAYVFKKPKSKK